MENVKPFKLSCASMSIQERIDTKYGFCARCQEYGPTEVKCLQCECFIFCSEECYRTVGFSHMRMCWYMQREREKDYERENRGSSAPSLPKRTKRGFPNRKPAEEAIAKFHKTNSEEKHNEKKKTVLSVKTFLGS